MSEILRIGVDVGSTTIKIVVLDSKSDVIYKNYERHFSETANALKNNLLKLKDVIHDTPFYLTMTGSSGMGLAQRLGIPFEQEVLSCTSAIRKLIPDTDTAIELGGEDAKITYTRGSLEQRMNGACAGGTGAFIDQMANLLNTDAQGLNTLAKEGSRIYTIASRCGVFAKTDIQALINDGAKKEDLALSILQAVVNQTLGTLAQGRPVEGKVAFLGGPLTFISVLKERFISTLNLDEESVIDTPDACYFVAYGAALCEESVKTDISTLLSSLQTSLSDDHTVTGIHEPLFSSKEDYDTFVRNHSQDIVKRRDIKSYSGPVYVGIDAGSTTSKLAAVTSDNELLYTIYRSNQGSPLNTVANELKELYENLSDGCYIAGVTTTGYGESLVKAALHADFGEVETFAHLRAAREFCPEVSFIMDIGGQDMKCFFVSDGNIGNITLNEACSAGCGSFIETFAKNLNLTAAQFADLAAESKAPVDLGTRCTVFMNSKVKQAQKDGASLGDISAGISISVIKNALFKVMQLKDVSSLGNNIVVQGGTFLNNAVLKAMETLIGKRVIRPDISGHMGAYGAAILAKEKGTGKSSVLSKEELDSFSFKTRTYRCHKCGNNCMITMQIFSDLSRHFTGNRCEKGIGNAVKKDDENNCINLYKYKYHRVFDYKALDESEATRGTIGIPRCLNMYEDYPFWFTLFTKLGYRVVLSEESSAQIYQKGLSTIPSDSLCYPAKLVHGHIMTLIENGIKKIFYPCLPFNLIDKAHPNDNHYNCPVVASYAENIRGNMDILKEQNITFWQPFLPVNNIKRLCRRLYEELKTEKLGRKEIMNAAEAAYEELEKYKQDVRSFASKVIENARKNGSHMIMLVGRPYHIDPEINHGIADMIESYGLPVISEDSVYHQKVRGKKVGLINQWSYHARLYHAAQYVVENKDTTLIQLSSFGCGLDAITTDQVKEILEENHRIYTLIKLDEVSNLGSARIRLRSLLATLARKQIPSFSPIPFTDRPRFTKECVKKHTILAPQMAPIHFELFRTVLYKFGYNVVIPALPDKSSIDLGLRYVNNDMCYPAIVVIGQMLEALKSGLYDPDNTSIMLFQTCGACRATNYIAVLRKALKYAGFPQVPVFAIYGLETDEFKMPVPMYKDAIKAAVYGDLLMKLVNRVKPYEIHSGQCQEMYDRWLENCKQELLSGSTKQYKKNIYGMVHDFESIPINDIRKPKVGIVGEILVKYHPIANNFLEQTLFEEGAEVVMPDFVDFFLYLAGDPIIEHNLLEGKLMNKFLALTFIRVVEHYRKYMYKALKKSKRFAPPVNIFKTAKLASRFVSLGNMAGEGWFLTGEMVKLIEHGVPNIVCLQPFGCLPNHITGKGVVHALRQNYEDANIVTIDCDAGASEVNQINRVKLMLGVAKDNLKKTK
ncbi:MAG: acyl-CoA dehydratase activase-related protein [Succinivibrio sp.]